MWIKGLVLGAVLACCVDGPGSVSAQQPVFRGSGDIVRVFSTVTDRDGRLVPNLGRDDFEVRDGVFHPQGERT